MIKFVDENLQSIWAREDAITGIASPSPLSPSNAKCLVFLGAIAFPVTHSEANRLIALLNPTKEDSCQSQPAKILSIR